MKISDIFPSILVLLTCGDNFGYGDEVVTEILIFKVYKSLRKWFRNYILQNLNGNIISLTP